MTAATRALREAILRVLATGPQRLQTLRVVTGYSARRTYKVIAVLHREGRVRRLGTKGSSCWAAPEYDGPAPKHFNPTLVHNPARHTVRARIAKSPNGAPAAYADRPSTPLADSWWTLPANREAFRQAAAARAAAMGWDR